MREAFVYLWEDRLTNKKYIGYHKGSVDDGYICSSKIMLEEYNKRPNDFEKTILMIGSVSEMRKLESKLLNRFSAATNEEFYNKHNADWKFYNEGHSEETKYKISIAQVGRKLSEEHKQKLSEARKKHSGPNKGKKLSLDHREKLRDRKLGKNNPNFGKERPETQKEAMRKYNASLPTVICPHCGKNGQKNVMIRWHFDNCIYYINK